MREGIYLGPGGQLVEYFNGCIGFGVYTSTLGGTTQYNLQYQYLCRQEKYLLAGFEYLGKL